MRASLILRSLETEGDEQGQGQILDTRAGQLQYRYGSRTQPAPRPQS